MQSTTIADPIRFVTANYERLQGLRLVPAGATMLAVGLVLDAVDRAGHRAARVAHHQASRVVDAGQWVATVARRRRRRGGRRRPGTVPRRAARRRLPRPERRWARGDIRAATPLFRRGHSTLLRRRVRPRASRGATRV